MPQRAAGHRLPGLPASLRLPAPVRRLAAGPADLWALLLAAGDEGVALGSRVRLHRGLLFTVVALAASLASAALFRAQGPGAAADLEWYGFGFRDERWLVLGYWLCVASALTVPLVTLRGRAGWGTAATCAAEPARAVALRTLAAIGVYVLWLGPPWNVDQLARPMEWHEIVHLGPLQALLVGKDLYLESGTQYGPGLQMLSLHYLEAFGVSLARFREFWLWTNFAGGLVLVAWLARLSGGLPLVAGLLVLRFFSPFGFFRASDGASFDFFFGWATCIRYAGAVHVVLAVAHVLARERAAGDDVLGPGERAFLLASGVFWGLLVLVSQENLVCGLAGLGLLGIFALLTRTVSPARGAGIGLVVGGGALLGCLPLVAPFAAAGQLDAFLQRYFEIGGYVAQGYSNAAFEGPWLSPAGLLYATVPACAAALFAVAALDRGARRRWRTMSAATAALTLACFAPALLRSDEQHILAAVLPLALLVATAATGLRRAGVRPASVLVLSLALLPAVLAARPAHLERLVGDVRGRLRAIVAPPAPSEPLPGRIGYVYDPAAPYSVFSGLPLGEFLAVSRRLHEAVDSRPVVIASAIGTRGHWYFFADLRPLLPDPEPSMTIVNAPLRARYLARLDAAPIPCVISTRPQDAELALFHRQSGPRDAWTIETSAADFYVACLRDAEAPGAAGAPPS